MKKIIAIVLAVSSLFFLTVSNALAEWSAGVSVSHGDYKASGTETLKESGKITKSSENGQFTYPSIFLEYNLGRVSLGLDVIPGSVSTEEVSRTDYNNVKGVPCTGNDGCGTGVTNKASVELSRHVSLYALVPIMDTGSFVRAAVMRADVNTKETLNTGSTYPDKRIYGGTIGLGYQHDFGAGYVRAEVGHSEYEKLSLTSTNADNKVSADLDGNFGRISIGRSF